MGDVTYTSGRIETYSSSVNDGVATTYTYTYDQNGNITSILYGTGEEIRYYYDDIGQLAREDNAPLGATYVYTYDNAGNRTSKAIYSLTAKDVAPVDLINTFTYGYSTPTASGAVSWGDLLMTYNGTSNVYDKIGNPLSYHNGQTYWCAWSGRSLIEVRKNDVTYKFTYNDSGIRTSKTVNGVTTNYYLSGSQIVAEETSGNLTVYIYDATGAPIGFQYHAASYAEGAFDTYWYEKNVFGDIVAVYDDSGTKLLTYTYDAWVGEIKQLITVLSKPKPPKATSARSERTERHGATMRRWRAKTLQQLTTTAVQIYLKLQTIHLHIEAITTIETLDSTI